jgi:M6 family metalloprotease-like protein
MPDGTELNVRLVGDESGHYWLSEDNQVIDLDSSGFFRYATLDATGGYEVSATKVTPLALRGDSERRFVAGLDRQSVLSALESQRNASGSRRVAQRSKETSELIGNFPSQGEQRAIVVLVEYQDEKFKVASPAETFNNMLNQRAYADNGATGSVADWFIDNSCGQFTPQFDVYGPITLSHDMAYYGANDKNGDDEFAYMMAVEACQQLDDKVDFTLYDRDHNGVVDNVYIFYAGYGENLGASEETVWPHSDDISDITSQIYTFDGVRLDHYACSNERKMDDTLEGIGTFCHEFSHVMGLPDLYATNYSSAFTPGAWSVLDEGPYNNDSHTPPYYTVYERYSLGWLTPKEIGKPANLTLDVISANQGFLITSDNDTEYFLLENRQQQGWDLYIPSHGMLVWHIDYNEGVWNTNTVNNKRSHQYVDIVEADNIESDGTLDGDPFPGSYNITSFTDDTAPGMRCWDGTGLSKPITEITERDGIISFAISGGTREMASVEALEATDVDMEAFTANWTASAEADSYLLTVYTTTTLPSGKITYNYVDGFEKCNVGNVTSYRVAGLQPATDYKYSVRCADSESGMESLASNEVAVTTLLPSFELTSPVALAATDVTADGFTANWQAVDGADGYRLSVYTKQYGEAAATVADFTDGLSALPAGWDTNSNLTYSQSAYSGAAVPSLRLATTDSYIATPSFSDFIRGFEFWHRGVNASAGSSLRIGALVGGVWSELTTFEVENGAGGKVITLDETELPNQCMALSITYQAEGRGSVAIDDIKVLHGGLESTTTVTGYDDLSVGNCEEYHVALPMENNTYYYTIIGTSGDTVTLASNEIAVGRAAALAAVVPDADCLVKVNGTNIMVTSGSDVPVALYSVSGVLIKHGKVSAGITLLQAPGSGIYLLQVGMHTFRIVAK